MYSLCLETCLGGFYVGVGQTKSNNGFDILKSKFDKNPRVANATIQSEVSRLMSDLNLSPSDLGEIILSTGPGSFTGIKLSSAFALGLKFSHPKSIVIKSFDALSSLSKMLSKRCLLKSTSKTGFLADSAQTQNIELDAVKKGDLCWNEWEPLTNQSIEFVENDSKSEYLDKMFSYVVENNLLNNFSGANYLKAPIIHKKKNQKNGAVHEKI